MKSIRYLTANSIEELETYIKVSISRLEASYTIFYVEDVKIEKIFQWIIIPIAFRVKYTALITFST